MPRRRNDPSCLPYIMIIRVEHLHKYSNTFIMFCSINIGAVSMAGVEPGLWNVVGGNHQVPMGLLWESGANLVRGKVKSSSL